MGTVAETMSVADITIRMSATDIKWYARKRMVRWEPDARGRLEKAALELYLERGFDNTTVAEIAERAGLTERTFFRYFADKREVLFSGSLALQELLISSAVNAPDSASPMEAVADALEAAGALLQQRGQAAKNRQKVIVSNTELRERELIKMASWASALSDALRQRGVPDPAAALTAEAAIAVFRVAFERWVQEPTKRDLPRIIRESFDELRAVTAGSRDAVNRSGKASRQGATKMKPI